jgi:serine/threonine protein kinase
MKKVCLLCERTSPDNNLFCQETYCPAEMCPYILDYGEWLGDIEIIRPITILRSSALYEARHNKHKVLLKVAHPGPEHTERLKREATFLRDIAAGKKPEASLPVLCAPYANTTIEKDPYGRAMLREHLLYFCLFEHFEGDSLRDILIKNSQLWIYHVGWIMISLASAVAFLQSKAMYHYGLSPDTVLVRFSEEAEAPQVLLFDLGIASDHEHVKADWYPSFVPPAYTAPELIGATLHRRHATDVHGLGLILYELLVGSPTIPFKLRGDDEVYEAVRQGQRVRMNRVEDVKEVAEIAVTAVSPNPDNRQKNAAEVADALLKSFGDTPAKRKRPWPSPRTALLITAALIAIAFLLIVGVSVTGLGLSR